MTVTELNWTEKLIGEGNGAPLQYSCLENPTDGGVWWATVRGVAKSRTQLSDFTFTFHFHALKREMATHSSVLDWRIPGMGEPVRLPSMGSHRVGHDWSDLAAESYQSMLKWITWVSFCEVGFLSEFWASCSFCLTGFASIFPDDKMQLFLLWSP